MLMSAGDLHRCLDDFLNVEDKRNFDQIFDLVMVGVLTHEFAFQCDPRDRTRMKSSLVVSVRQHLLFDGEVKELYVQLDYVADLADCDLGFGDFNLLCLTARKLTGPGRVDIDPLSRWIENAWNVGVSQRRVNDMELEGSINNSNGIAMNFATSVCLYGSSEEWRLIPKGNSKSTQEKVTLKVFSRETSYGVAVIVAENAEDALIRLRAYEMDENLSHSTEPGDLKEIDVETPGVVAYHSE